MTEKKKTLDKAVEKTAEKKETKTFASSKSSIAKSAFYYNGTHFKKGDDLSKMKKEDLEFVTKKGKVE